MRIFITGSRGLVGSHLVASLKKNNDHTLLCPSIEELDITMPKSIDQFFAKNNPELIIHFAAYTDVTETEKQRHDKKRSAWIINVEGTRNIAQVCARNNIHFIHISTDTVFSGKKENPGPYNENHPIETDETNTSWYGWTKINAEKAVQELLKDHTIIRISNPTRTYYDVKLDYVRKILFLYDQNKLHPFFDDQHLTLTFINNVTRVIEQLIKSPQTDIFHVSSSDLFIPFDLASYLLKKTRKVQNAVQRTSLEEYSKKNPNRYIQYSGLATTYTQEKLGIQFPAWKQIIDAMIKEGLA